MNKLTRYLLLLFASVLALPGWQADDRAAVFCAVEQAVAEEHTQASLSAGESIKSPSLTRAEEQISLFQHLPGPSSKNDSKGAGFLSFTAELQLQRAITQYIASAVNLNRSLSGSDIIFPFHYFW
ncbi:hypothetical protein H9Q13_04740 [Pontibacter sp. JH31]|uniref:Uncharacterized protein n=1 Tax=Pontibacter aquaedesilientis TaxID=2766980 RepID=A0ABR7XDW4_9BACT|nr:hypothetical protein [Pontibacter aquaedesilientis]MBD1396462.1 hypothetical protein [Pontibacter aquaedesilientis]